MESLIGIVRDFYEEPNTYTQDEIVDMLVGTALEQGELKQDEIPEFRAWVKVIVRTCFYFYRKGRWQKGHFQ